ncbi:MAG: glycosyl transferase family 2 [Theionarchaea archaeon DG-70]|nr:MAG: glycosyl transferase family 2 [Theionarchaea archaeon DG-70]
MKNYPKVTVLMLTYNGKHLLEESLTSYLHNDYQNFTITVIDNGSYDGTYTFIKEQFPQVEIIRSEHNLGYAGGINFGLAYAFNQDDTTYVLLTNNDVKADKRLIRELVKIAEEDEKNGFVTGKVYFYDNPTVLQTVGKKSDPVRWNGGHIGNREKDNGQYDEVSERFFADDIYMLVSRKLYEEIGGMKTLFFFQAEDYEWQARAKTVGYKIMYTPFAKLWHKVSMTIGKDSSFKAFYDAKNPMLVVLLHKSPQFFKRYFWLHVRSDIVHDSMVFLKRGKVTNALARWQGLFSGIKWGFKNKKLSMRHFI